MPSNELPEYELVGPAPQQPSAGRQGTRSKARKRALDILFEADLRGIDPLTILAERAIEESTTPIREFTHELVRGVAAHADEIDDLIAGNLASGWTLTRIPRVDRCACRLGVYELRHTDIAPKVAIAEAVALAEQLSTDDSAAFVNGVLGKIARS